MNDFSVIGKRIPKLDAAKKAMGRADLIGNLVNAVPSADGAIPLIALDAKARIYGPKGERLVELGRFFLGPGQCDLSVLQNISPVRELQRCLRILFNKEHGNSSFIDIVDGPEYFTHHDGSESQ